MHYDTRGSRIVQYYLMEVREIHEDLSGHRGYDTDDHDIESVMDAKASFPFFFKEKT